MPRTVPLSKPLKTHAGEITELTFRELTGGDIAEMSLSPIAITLVEADGVKGQKVDIRYDIAMKYLARLTGIDTILLGSLPAKDFSNAAQAVIAEFNALGE